MYKWNLNELKKRRMLLTKELICNLKLSIDDKIKIKADLNLLDNMINQIDTNKSFRIFPKKDITFIDKNKLFPKLYYDAYLKISPKILKILFPIITEYDQIDIKDDDYSYYELSEEELISSAIKFYQSLPSQEYYKEIEKYLSPNNHLLQILYGDIYSNTTGSTYYIESPTKTTYILMQITNQIHDLLTLDHELAHAHFDKYNAIKNYQTPYYYITETEGLFFEYLKEEYLLNQDITKEDIYKKRVEYFNDFTEMILNLYVGRITAYQFSITKEINEQQILKTIYENGIPPEYTDSFIYESLYSYPRNNIKECISYLTFLDLKNIANNDIEKALYLLENIRSDKNPNIISTLRKNNITFMDDDYQNLNQEYQKLKEYKI